VLVVSGGIAAYKSLDLVRRLRERGAVLRCVLTQGGAHFITPLSLSALAGDDVHTDLFATTAGGATVHIQLTRDSDLVVVAPASADLIGKMTHGLADDLASALLLASDKPILVAPAMNYRMWQHPATQANIAQLDARGVRRIGPNAGSLGDGETGDGRMAEPLEIVAAIETFFGAHGPLAGRHALVTSGPTQEPIDPVRYISNRSSGKQGHAIAESLHALGARVTLVSGPVALPDPAGVNVIHVETAQNMLDACMGALPADVAICAAAVADWRMAAPAAQKLKKAKGAAPPQLDLAQNPDILATLSQARNRRPRLVVGFAAETEKVIDGAKAKLASKGCDVIVANDVSAEANAGTGAFGTDSNTVHLVTAKGVESWPALTKSAIATRLAGRVASLLNEE
jgi:phosphopantothenoylcysteine decarboxylase/phosphopantothenate--cysteine ligase